VKPSFNLYRVIFIEVEIISVLTSKKSWIRLTAGCGDSLKRNNHSINSAKQRKKVSAVCAD
jgi:hypothetical protein